MQAQLNDVQRQLVELLSSTSSKAEILELENRLSVRSDRALRSEADLKVELEALTGQIVELEESVRDTLYRIDQLSQQVAMTNQELRALITAPAFPRGEDSEATAPLIDPQTAYDDAYGEYQRGRYELALIGFKDYLETFPDTDLADNALYWIGECHFTQQRFDLAIEAFNDLVIRFPGSDKVASAQLKGAFAHIQRGDLDRGFEQLRELLRQHPSSPEAELARREINRLGSENRDGEPSSSR